MTAAPSRIALARRARGAEGVRALLIEVFARCDTAAAACDELGMRRTARGDALVAPVSALRRAAQRAGVPWPYTARGRPDLRRRT
jgi:hypothetical protein